ncbi:hypothetical protein Ciccas_006492, partial [Cichlidogyrus casuarinus]
LYACSATAQPSARVLLDLLRAGWHLAATELTDLLDTEMKLAKETMSSTSASLATNPDILAKLQHELSVVESAQRRGDNHTIFLKYMHLAEFFDDLNFPDKIWVRDRYVTYMMAAANRIKDDHGYKQANALAYFALIRRDA